jgi:lactate permease
MINLLISICALLPIVSVILCILLFKKNSVFSSFFGLIIAIFISFSFNQYKIDFLQFVEAAKSAFILSLSAILVIVPGLYLNGVIREQKYIDKITYWVENLPISPANKSLILLTGFLPAVESLTGFGVSLFLSVPIFLKLFPSNIALKLSLLGMNIMPWGTLALATVIGSSLLQEMPAKLGTLTSLTSSIIFPYLALASLYVIGSKKTLYKHAVTAIFLGVSLSLFLFVSNYFLSAETAGVISGIVTGLIGIYISYPKKSQIKNLFSLVFLRTFLPYFLVLLIIGITNLIQPVDLFISQLLVLKSQTVKFSLFASPGITLILVSLIMQAIKPVKISIPAILSKSRNACLSITTFLLLSQVMLQSGMIKNLATSISQYAGAQLFTVLSPLIGMMSGFVTGSNTGGNALLIAAQQKLGDEWGQGLLFSAAHNSGAGHAVFSSIPIIVLVLTIFKDEAFSDHLAVEESSLLTFTLKVSIGIYFSILLSLSILFHFNVGSILF